MRGVECGIQFWNKLELTLFFYNEIVIARDVPLQTKVNERAGMQDPNFLL